MRGKALCDGHGVHACFQGCAYRTLFGFRARGEDQVDLEARACGIARLAGVTHMQPRAVERAEPACKRCEELLHSQFTVEARGGCVALCKQTIRHCMHNAR